MVLMLGCDKRVNINGNYFLKNPEGKKSHEKIGPLMNEEGHEINDDSKTAELLNSFLKSAFNKRNEAKKYRQLGSNEDTAKSAAANEKIREILTWQSLGDPLTRNYVVGWPACLLSHTYLFLKKDRILASWGIWRKQTFEKYWRLLPRKVTIGKV